MHPTVVEVAEMPVAFFLVITMIAGLAVFLTGLRLVGRARVTSPEGRAGWLFLAAVASGGGIWASSVLPLLAAAGERGFNGSLVVTGLFVAVAGSLVTFVILGRQVTPGRAAIAGLATTATAVVVASLVLAAVVGDAAFHLGSPGVLISIGCLVVVAGLAHWIAGTGETDTAEAASALLLAIAVPLAAVTIAWSTGLAPVAPVPLMAASMGPWALGSVVGVFLFAIVGTGMATALIHRDAEFTSQVRLRRLADASIEGLAIVDGNSIVEANEALVRIVGRPAESLVGETLVGSLVTGDGIESTASLSVVREAFLTLASGGQVPVELVARPIEYDGKPHEVVAIRDLSDRRDAELRIRFLADHDILTGIPNRGAFKRELDQRCEALADGGSFALICVDLDRFKEANDVFGHKAGDDVLVEVARRLGDLLPPESFSARMGGDEFVAIVRDLPVPQGVGDLADQIVASMSAPFMHDGQRIGIGASVGVALAPTDGDTPDLLLARADMALYRAKQQGRGQSCFFEVAMDDEMRFRRTLAFELREAIEGNQLELAYQPLADLSSSGVTGFEALVRWNHPEHGQIAPTIFVAIAEEAGLITRLGEWVLRTACTEAAGWDRPLTIAVNLSPLQLEQQALPDVVRDILLRTGLSARRLELEVTENALMRNPQRALDVLRRLKALGIRVAMDDFGTGYSSLSTLQSFPFDKLKIDRSFVDRVDTHGQAASIVRAVVGLSRSLDIRVVAEGVETTSQIDFLAGEACDEVQGFMIGMPLPISAYAHLTSKDADPAPDSDHKSAAA